MRPTDQLDWGKGLKSHPKTRKIIILIQLSSLTANHMAIRELLLGQRKARLSPSAATHVWGDEAHHSTKPQISHRKEGTISQPVFTKLKSPCCNVTTAKPKHLIVFKWAVPPFCAINFLLLGSVMEMHAGGWIYLLDRQSLQHFR